MRNSLSRKLLRVVLLSALAVGLVLSCAQIIFGAYKTRQLIEADAQRILRMTDPDAQRLLFSATLDQGVAGRDGQGANDAAALGAHLEACVAALVAYVATLSDDELDDVVDPSYTPPVTRGVRLVSIIDDAAVHLGQAAYARGLVDGWSYGV